MAEYFPQLIGHGEGDVLPLTIWEHVLLGLHPALGGFGAAAVARPGLTGLVDEFDMGAAGV